MFDPKKGVSQKFLEIAQNRYISVVFDAEHEYDTLRCHISSMSHAIPEKGCQITKFYKSLKISILI